MNIKEDKINNFSFGIRNTAFESLLNELPSKNPKNQPHINMHVHTFHSYNAVGWSPSRIALHAYLKDIKYAAIVDFDVLEGIEEFYAAAGKLGLSASVGLETRAFNEEKSDVVFDSPGEPGISYILGMGFPEKPESETPEGTFLDRLHNISQLRNINLIQRINNELEIISISITEDVMKLCPSGNPTERHIVEAYINKSQALFNASEFLSFWSALLDISTEEVNQLTEKDLSKFEDMVRKKLVKQGGIGYKSPESSDFPSVKEVFKWMADCGAIPMDSWLDGTSEGEKDSFALLKNAGEAGAYGLNIIPDRNWNIKDSSERSKKYNNLCNIIEAARELQMPVNIGTEMNKAGQPEYDNIYCDALAPFAEYFTKSAKIICGHTLLSRFTDLSYMGLIHDGSIASANEFCERIGSLPMPSPIYSEKLFSMGAPNALVTIENSAQNGRWEIPDKKIMI